MLDENVKVGLTFDDVLLLPAKSDILPGQVDISTSLTNNIKINTPIVSAAMDTVTEANLAIAIAREGGIGIIHRAMPLKNQVSEVNKVKKSESGMITDPITLQPDEKRKGSCYNEEVQDIGSSYYKRKEARRYIDQQGS